MDGPDPIWGAPAAKPSPLSFISPTSLAGLPVPERDWIIPGWLPRAAVTLLYAAGGEGKTLLAQMLMTSCATGVPWLGLPVESVRCMGVFCEDDRGELHRRQQAICEAYGVGMDDLASMVWSTPIGEDNTLLRFARDGAPELTERYWQLREEALRYRPALFILDVAADFFGGNENDRQQVSTFIKFCLGGLARDLNAAVLINAHPSRAGISSGEIDGGSTAWTGSARSRWSLLTPAGDDGAPPDLNARVLAKKKANYGQRGEEIQLRWRDGVFWRDDGLGSGIVASIDKRNCENTFLELLQRIGPAGLHASASRNAANYAPRIFSQRSDRAGFRKADFERAMNALFTAGRIRVEQYGKPSNDTHHIVAVPVGDALEEGATVGDGHMQPIENVEATVCATVQATVATV